MSDEVVMDDQCPITLCRCRRECGNWCFHGYAPELSDREQEIVARFDAAEPAPESYVRQHRMSPTCWCGPTLAPGTKFGVLMHKKPEES